MPSEVLDAGAAAGSRITVHRADSLRDVPLPGYVDAAVILAGQTDVDEALADPARAFRANVDIAVDAAEWSQRSPASRLIYLSSDEVLGASVEPLAEDAPLNPTQPYAASKAAAEMVLRCYRDTYRLNHVVIRSCNLVGGHQRARKLIPTAVTNLCRGRPVPVFGSGAHVREWLAVEDLCGAIMLAVRNVLPAGTYHCSAGARLAVTEVVRRVADALGVPPAWIHVPDRLVHDTSYAMSASLLRSFGWQPRVDITDAIVTASRDLAAAHRRGDYLLCRHVNGPSVDPDAGDECGRINTYPMPTALP
jgi:dTDP-glucose 4,6-dehydratase